MKKYLIIIEKTKIGFGSYVPDISGCIAICKIKDDVEKNIYKTIKFHLESMKSNGLSIPEGKTEREIIVFS